MECVLRYLEIRGRLKYKRVGCPTRFCPLCLGTHRASPSCLLLPHAFFSSLTLRWNFRSNVKLVMLWLMAQRWWATWEMVDTWNGSHGQASALESDAGLKPHPGS